MTLEVGQRPPVGAPAHVPQGQVLLAPTEPGHALASRSETGSGGRSRLPAGTKGGKSTRGRSAGAPIAASAAIRTWQGRRLPASGLRAPGAQPGRPAHEEVGRGDLPSLIFGKPHRAPLGLRAQVSGTTANDRVVGRHDLSQRPSIAGARVSATTSPDSGTPTRRSTGPHRLPSSLAKSNALANAIYRPP